MVASTMLKDCVMGKSPCWTGNLVSTLDIETRRKCPVLIAEKRFHLRRFISIALLRDRKLFPTILRRGDEGKFHRQISLWRNCLLIILPREKLGLRQKPKGESGEQCRRSLTLAKRVGAAAGNHYPDKQLMGEQRRGNRASTSTGAPWCSSTKCASKWMTEPSTQWL